jgi:sugar phosphate isomerase/epimerase
MTPEAIGVCSWSLDRHDSLGAIRAAADLGIGVVQVGFFTAADLRAAKSIRIAQAAREAGVRLAGVFLAFEDEDYSSIARIAETGGLMPDDRAASRLALVREAAEIASALGCSSVAIHAGTVPRDANSGAYRKLGDRVGQAADIAREFGLQLSLETGRESIDRLLTFVNGTGRANIAINFDPANLVLYGVDEPARVVTKLRGRIDNVHVKDAKRSDRPGETLGTTIAIGTGEAEIPRVISKLRIIGYDGPLLIETRRGDDVHAVRDAAAYLRTLLL